MLDKIADLFAGNEERPNKFTRYMGDKIRAAREEASVSQEQLARRAYIRRATLSDIENGKSEASTGAFVLIAYHLKKPLAYFLPDYLYDEIKKEDISPWEYELITKARYHVASDQFRKLLIDIIQAIGKFDIDGFVSDQAPYTQAKLDNAEELEKLRGNRRRNR